MNNVYIWLKHADAEPLPGEADNEAERRHHSRHVSRRKSTRMPRQHSYDDELESSISTSHADPGLVLPGPLPRRASAYDVFSAPGGANLHRTSISGPSNQGTFPTNLTFLKVEVLIYLNSNRWCAQCRYCNF